MAGTAFSNQESGEKFGVQVMKVQSLNMQGMLEFLIVRLVLEALTWIFCMFVTFFNVGFLL